MTSKRNLTGLFLGAGASYEAGMPLVSELTTELTNWLTPEKLRTLNECWRSAGGGYADKVIDEFCVMLSRSGQNYESLLGFLEVQFSRHSPMSQEYHGLYAWLVDLIYHLLYFRHIKNTEYIRRNVGYYDGLYSLADKNRPLWVFSLNHDLIIECLSHGNDLPISSGFTSEVVELPRRNKKGQMIGQLQACILLGSSIENAAMPFLPPGTVGINLFKLHGSLDIFAFRDGKDLLKIQPPEESTDGPLESLRIANEELVYRPDIPVRATNEIAYADQSGELQFLRRSLLAGVFKFDSRRTQVLPKRLLEHFGSYLNYITTLVCIGYGFGDDHVNLIIRDWLEFSEERRLVIVDPNPNVPDTLLHVATQVELVTSTATEYLDSCAGVVRSSQQVNEKKLTTLVRKEGDSVIEEWILFCRRHQMDRAAELIRTLPVGDGNIDVDALGTPFEDYLNCVKGQFSSVEHVIDKYLKSREASVT